VILLNKGGFFIGKKNPNSQTFSSPFPFPEKSQTLSELTYETHLKIFGLFKPPLHLNKTTNKAEEFEESSSLFAFPTGSPPPPPPTDN
jgi:hypothetical protein